MLSDKQNIILDSGIQTVIPEAMLASDVNQTQTIYLDFDGATTSYRNQDLDITIDNVKIEDSGFDTETISLIVASLNEQFWDDIFFTAEIPQDEEYSTIYIGKTDAFDEYGEFLGLAETIDVGNQIHNDNAFVLLDSNASMGLVTSVIAHETQHIVSGCVHGEENLLRFARTYYGEKLSGGKTLSLYVNDVANNTRIQDGCAMEVYSGGIAKDTYIESGGCMDVYSGGTASNTKVKGSDYPHSKGAYVTVYSGGTANDTIVNAAGDIRVSGGTANNTIVNSGGRICIDDDSTVNNTIVMGGELEIYWGTANNTTVNSGGWIWIGDEATVNFITINEGSLQLDGGTANNTIVCIGGQLILYEGSATDVVMSGGSIFNEATVDKLSVCSSIHYEGGGVTKRLNFVVTEANNYNATAMVEDISMFTAKFSITVTANPDWEDGRWLLAGEVENFPFNITINSAIDDRTLGTISLASPTVVIKGYGTYTISLFQQKLYLDYTNDGIGPKPPAVSASTTVPTNQSVTVTATFDAEATIRQYSLNNVTWKNYTGSVTMSENGTVYFRSGDGTDYSEVVSYTVSNIDKTAPVKPTVTGAEDGELVTVTAEFSEDSVVRQYRIDGGNWQNYAGALQVAPKAIVEFRGKDEAGNWSETTLFRAASVSGEYSGEGSLGGEVLKETSTFSVVTAGYFTVTGNFGNLNATITLKEGKKTLATGTVKNGAVVFNKGKDVLLDKDVEYTLEIASADKGKTTGLYAVTVEGTTLFDAGDNSDDSLDSPALPVFDETIGWEGWAGYGDAIDYRVLTLDNAARLSFDVTATDAAKFTIWGKDAKGKMKSLQATALKANKAKTEYTAITKDLLLEAGTYHISVEATNAQKGGSADYSVALGERSVFFTEGDNSDDTATATALPLFDMADGWTDWAGYGDAFDYRVLTLDTAARLSFDVNATDAAKFTIWGKDAKTGKMKSLQSTALKANKTKTEYTLVSKDLLLEAGTYYLSVEATNAKKGGSADYSVVLGERTVFFTEGDNSDDAATAQALPEFDAAVGWEGWAGYGDAVDFRVLHLDTAACLDFDVVASDAAKFTIWGKDAKTGKLKSLQATTLKANKAKTEYSATNKNLMVAAGTYYLSVEASNAKKGGSADYTVSTGAAWQLFPQGDNSNDSWKMAALQGAHAVGETIEGWVGFGDTADFYKFEVEESGKVNLELDAITATAVKNKELKLSFCDANGKSIALTAVDEDTFVTKTAVALGECYLGVTCANVTKYNTEYSIAVGM